MTLELTVYIKEGNTVHDFKEIENANARYDTAGLINSAKKNLCAFIIKEAICIVLLVLSVLAVIFYSTYIGVFIGGVALACISAFLCSKLIKNFMFSDYSSAHGEITYIHKEIKIVPITKIGGINPFGTRKYDSYSKNEIRLQVFIQNGDNVRGYFLNDVYDEHADYYESRGAAMHIWGTHFPVKLEIGKDKWLCPLCGGFNENHEKTCKKCQKKVLK